MNFLRNISALSTIVLTLFKNYTQHIRTCLSPCTRERYNITVCHCIGIMNATHFASEIYDSYKNTFPLFQPFRIISTENSSTIVQRNIKVFSFALIGCHSTIVLSKYKNCIVKHFLIFLTIYIT